jgi:CRP-like cAMP-binding protein
MLPLNYRIENRLLTALDPSDLERLRPSLNDVSLNLRQVLELPGKAITYVYFIESGFVSVDAMSRHNRRIEVAMIGNEGMTGLAAILGDDRSVNETIVRGAGTALRLSTAELRPAMLARPALRHCLLRFVHSFLTQATQTSLANGCAKLEERLARWILMSQDRFAGGDLGVTHDLLALMLGVHRPGVTLALHFLEAKGLIKSTRSHISVIDRRGLHKQANASYGGSEAEYARLFGR